MRFLKSGRYYLWLVLIIAGTALASLALNQLGISKENILMLFIVGVLLVTAVTRGYVFGIVASLASVLIFNYFFTEPYHTFLISNANDIPLMLFFLIASVISSSVTARFQQQLTISQKNELTAKLLYEVSQRLLNVTGEANIIHRSIAFIKENTGYDSAVIIDETGQEYSSENIVSDAGGDCVYLPIMGLAKRLGTLKVYCRNSGLNIEQQWLVNTVAAQMGIALDREYVYNEREKIRVAMEKEHLKGNLLRSVSHDLRTPLTGIVGASSLILSSGKGLDYESVENLIKDINEQAVWLTNLVENILNMTRLDKGKLVINKQIEVVDDIIDEAISHVTGLSGRPFIKNVPDGLIAIPMDGKMILQVLINLLTNAVIHTAKDCPVELTVKQERDFVVFTVEDGGAGIDPSIKGDLFGAFVTSGKTGSDGRRGIGLGLAICKAVVEAHAGEITAGTSRLGGALFEFSLPVSEVS